jgi:hypothetical protein
LAMSSPYMFFLMHLTPLGVSARHEILSKINVRNNGHKTKLKRETRKFLTLNAICPDSHQTSSRCLMK